jgi:hypothetical protein
MIDFEFKYVPPEDLKEGTEIRKEYLLKNSSFTNDNYCINSIFSYLARVYNALTPTSRTFLNQKKEEEITDYIRGKLKEDEEFCVEDGWIVNTEARNQAEEVGFYDLKFEHSDWKKNYLVLECKRIDGTKSKIDDYVYKLATNTRKEDGGMYRFVINKYATDKPFGGMLGYVIANSPEKVITKLKKRVRKFQIVKDGKCFGELQKAELLETLVPNFPHSFQSDHRRQSDQIVHIFHLFFDFTQKTRDQLP